MNKKNKMLYYTAFLFVAASIVFLVGVTYVLWRWMYTLNLLTSPFTTFWSYALCIAEILTLIVFTNFSIILLKSHSLGKVEIQNELQNDYAKDVYKDGHLVDFSNFCPSVDVFICTLNESPDILSTTISACKNIDYPNHKVYVLDDGHRDEIKTLTEMLGCNYISRDTNKGFKAGNINNALSQTSSDIVVIFDADHIPASTFLRETIYHFVNEKVALVQTPQKFCNLDAFQKNLELPMFLANEQDMFYRIIEPSLNEFDSVFCGGTNILIKREALEKVGNFPEDTITEDSLLGLKFHSYGYKVVYYNKPIAIGLAASNFEEYIKQRSRWARGNVQIVMNPANWKYYAKLSPVQAFFYLSGVLYFFTPIARIIFLMAPVLFLFFDISPVMVLFYQIFAFQMCYFALKLAFISLSKVRFTNVIFADVYDLVTSIFTIGGILKTMLLPGKLSKIKFAVTKKDSSAARTSFIHKFTMVSIFLVLLAAEMQGVYDLLYAEVYSVLAVWANLFWNTLNIIVVLYGVKAVTEKPERRAFQRIKLEESLTLRDNKHNNYQTIVNDISRSGLNITVPDEFRKSSEKDLKANIQGEETSIKILDCKDEKGKFVCKSIFKNPYSIIDITKKYISRIENYVKFTYKKPDKWDDYYEENTSLNNPNKDD